MTVTFDDVLARFGQGTWHGHNFRTLCPVHGDTDPSLDIAEGDSGTPLFQCRSHHCQTGDILSAVGLTWGDVLPQSTNGHKPETWDHIYEYRDRDGTLRYRVYRRDATATQGKVIRQRAADGTWSLKGIAPLPYRLPELAAIGGPSVLVVEGEKTVDALMKAGFTATTNSGGAGKWRDSDTQALKDAGFTSFVILPDHDAPGTAHAVTVEVSAAKHSIVTRRVILPGLPDAGDAADWLKTHTPEDLEAALKPPPPALLLNLDDANVVAAEGQKIEQDGIDYVVDGIVPDYGMLGFLVASAKVGKSSLGLFLAECVATGGEFLGREVTRARKVLVIAAEDPPEYVAYLARHLDVPPGQITFSRAPIQLNAEGLALIVATVKHGGYGLVIIASWQAVISTLVKDENDNAGSVAVVENVKLATRETKIPWLVDAHAGKSEDQTDDADPTKALRGASAAAGAADFMLSLRYAGRDTFATRRRLSGKGRFVQLSPMTIDYDLETGRYVVEEESKSAHVETTWALIVETGALTDEWAGVAAIACRAGLATSANKATGSAKRAVSKALHGRPGVDRVEESIVGRTSWKFRRSQ